MTMTNLEWIAKKDIRAGNAIRCSDFGNWMAKNHFGEDVDYWFVKWLDMEHEETESKHNDVKHAHWIDMRLDDVHVCSHCDKVVVFMNGNEPNYCPYCGARMDEKGNE